MKYLLFIVLSLCVSRAQIIISDDMVKINGKFNSGEYLVSIRRANDTFQTQKIIGTGVDCVEKIKNTKQSPFYRVYLYNHEGELIQTALNPKYHK